MLEIVFDQSAEGMLKYAQHYGEGPYRKEAIGLIFDETEGNEPSRLNVWLEKQKIQKKRKAEWENAEPLGGNPGDVFGFSLGLWYGNIEDPVLGVNRKAALDDLFLSESDDERSVRQLEKIMQRLDEMRQRAEEGEPVRIWYSDSPNDRCGICWFCKEMQSWKMCPQIFTIKLPELCEEGTTKVHYRGWGEVGAERVHRFVTLQNPLTEDEMMELAAEWECIQSENTPLRIVQNGKLQSAPIDYYDSVLREELAKQPQEFAEACLIGTAVEKIAVSDSFMALRIEEWIQAGKLKIIKEETPGSRSYRRWLKKID